MSGRHARGFTLLELIVAVVLAGVVALLVYGAAGAAADIQERLWAKRAAVQSARAMRVAIEDALRNARPALRYGDTVLVLEDRTDDAGRPADRLSFVAAGALAPLTPDADWSVTLAPTAEGLTLAAIPLGFAEPSRVVARLAGVVGLDVRVLPPGPGQSWSDRWTLRTKLPRAVELTYWADTGAIGSPVRLALPAGAER
jgi:prepilin-type N-terminal cleavage/methylation domain-containing protein